jgi:hypothetical protein
MSWRSDRIPLEKHDQLELKEDYRVDGRSPASGVDGPNKLAHEREVEGLLDMAIEVVDRDQVLQRNAVQQFECPQLDAHHDRRRS